MHAAKTHLSRLLDRVEAGEEIVIARNNRPVARLVAYAEEPVRAPGRLRGQLHIAKDFDDPLPEDLMRAFDGGASPRRPESGTAPDRPESGDHATIREQS